MTQRTPLPAPLIGPEKTLTEITVKGLILGIILSMLLASANAYIGLLVGLTVSASIPAAAISMGILRLFKNSNILENNMVQTSASAGESLVAGIIFTVPALILMQAWQGYEYWPLVSIAIVGGVLGVAFTIPLRQALIVKAQLTFPEGVATSEVLKTGAEVPVHESIHHNTGGLRHLLQAAGIGALFKLCESAFGMLAGWISGVQAWFSGHILITLNLSLSPALVGVGYIVGLNVAFLVFLGGVIGTLIGVPLNWLINSDSILVLAELPASTDWKAITTEQWQQIAAISWDQNRRIGVGAMMVGGLWSLVSLYKPVIECIKTSLSAYKNSLNSNGSPTLRTELDTPIHYVAIVSVILLIPVYFIFHSVLEGYENATVLASIMTILMFILGFIFASVAGYMAGLVGSSNNPISGVTIATVIISALLLFQLMEPSAHTKQLGPIAVIFLAALICASAAIASDNMQDLKCGHILGSTPWRQQVYQVVGVISAALVIPIILQILDSGYGIGRPTPGGTSTTFLAAPQATLMKDLSTGIFGAGIDWNYILFGAGLAVAIIALDEYQKKRGSNFRFPILAVAVGIYLPIGLGLPILFGGLVANAVIKRSTTLNEDAAQSRKNTGLLLASGLITGEALMGVLIAVLATFFIDLPHVIPYGEITGLVALSLVILYLYKRTKSG